MSLPPRLLGCLLFLALIAGSVPNSTHAQESDKESWRFGVIESYESPSQAKRLGVGWTRVTFHWAEVQAKGPDAWTAPLSDEQIASEIDAGRMIVGLLIGIPDWARADDRLPQGLWAPYDDPENTWSNYVSQVVSKYRGRIDHWIIWNEPDIREGELAHTWDGSVADFGQLQRSAYLAAKAANPGAVIHLPAFTYWADYQAGSEQYMALLLDEILKDPQAAANNYYFDVATAHLYFQPGQIYDLLGLFTNIMRERGIQHPIWLVETNAPPINDSQWPVPNWTLSVTQQEQAAFMPQALVSALAAGAERIGLYKLKDTEDDRLANPEPFGLVRMDGSERPAFATYRLAVGYLSGAIRAERERWDDIGQIRVDQIDQTTTVLFSRLPEWQRVQVSATADEAQLVDMWGTKQVITPTKGFYTVDLQPASCSHSIGEYCMIGGPNYYLIQAADVPLSTTTPLFTSTPLPTSTILPTATPTDTPTPPASPTKELPTATAAIHVPAPATVAPTTMMTATATPSRPAATASPPPLPQENPAISDFAGLLFVGGGLVLVVILILLIRGRRRQG